MKIAYYVSNRTLFPPSPNDVAASSVLVANIRAELRKRHEVTVYAPLGSAMTNVEIIDNAISPIRIDKSNLPTGWEKNSVYGIKEIFLGDLIKNAKKYDIIHLHTEPVYMGMPMAALSDTPILFTSHHPYFEADRKIYEFYDGKINFSAISRYQASRFPMSQKIDIVYNGIEVDQFTFSDASDNYFLFLGRLETSKGIEDFISAAIKDQVNKYIIAGVGEFENLATKMAKQYKNIEYKGMVARKSEEWRKLFQHAKALIVPTTGEESFGLVIIEAMAHGTPVLAYDACANKEIIEDGKTGFICADKNADGIVLMVNKLNQLSTTRYTEMRKNSRLRAEKYFSTNQMVLGYEQIYKEIIDGR